MAEYPRGRKIFLIVGGGVTDLDCKKAKQASHPLPQAKVFLQTRCFEITSDAVFESKIPSVLSVAFGKQNS